MTQEAELLLDPADIVKLAEALEEGDVTALGVTAETLAREWVLIAATLAGKLTVRQDGVEWVFLNPSGTEAGRIFDVKARP